MLGATAAGLAAACASPSAEKRGAAANVAFNHGVASGDPRQDRVLIWTRVTPAAPGGVVQVSWVVSRDPTYKDVVQKGVFATGPERDYTVKIDVERLEPNKPYYYFFRVGKIVSPGGATRTLPSSGTAEYRMVVVSCSHYAFGHFNVYREIAKRNNVDAVIHLGDYIYEYGTDGYGGDVGREIGRNHEPPHECVTLADYRTRYSQYRRDPDLQAAHACAPWFCTWDDHETADNSSENGAVNHQAAIEGDWTARKAAAVQAYLEWMPMRDPEAGRPRDAVWRSFDIGDLATLFLIETRLTARGDDISLAEFVKAQPAQKQAVANSIKARLNDPNRRMMGPEQEAWLEAGFRASTASGKKWQVIGNQTVMAKIHLPDLQKGLSPQQYSQVPEARRGAWQTAKYGLEWDLDAWSGFPLSRERLFASARAANARLVVLSGDSHTAWANELHDNRRQRWGVEFACTSVTSPGAGNAIPFKELGWMMPEANDEVVYYNAFDKGYTLLTLKADRVEGEYIKVSTIRSKDYFASTDARFFARAAEIGMGGLQRPVSSGQITKG
jgi:phosphodiesterase/alkaline phosphatase D-like protein